MFKTKNLGFSLLELLVVISIIGILIAVGTASYTGAQKKARDQRRISDLKTIQTAQEQRYGDVGHYRWIAPSGQNGAACGAHVKPYLEAVPQDPKNVDPTIYKCRMAAIGDDGYSRAYCISARLESTPGNCGGCASCTNQTNCPFTAGDTHFCVKSLQQ